MQKLLNSSPKGLWLVLLFSLLLASPIGAWAQSVTVQTDRQTVEFGDVITLIIETDFQTGGNQLDLTVLEDQFEVLGKQQSNNLQYINGGFSSRTRWQVQLLAKHIGELIVPAFQIENATSQPVTITVLPVQKTSQNDLGPYFLESSISKQQVTVQEEVIYHLRLYFLGSVSGNIRPPLFDQALWEPLKEQAVYGKKMNGKTYSVYEWVYAIYPQQSGLLEIPGAQFTGLIQYNGRQKAVSEIADTQTLTVLPETAEFKNQSKNPWLPASALQFKEQWISALDEVRVGDSLSRTVTLNALGLKASQLPVLTTPNGAGYKVYADPAVSEQVIVKNGLQSQVKVKQAIIPTQTGPITLPEQTITWWNTTLEKTQTATLSARTLTVLPALATQAPLTDLGQVLSPESLDNAANASAGQQISAMVSRETKSIWQIMSLLLLFILVITLLLWRRKHKQMQAIVAALQPAQTPVVENNQAWSNSASELCETDKQGDLKLTPEQFYNKLRIKLAELHKIHSLEALEYPELQTVMGELEAHLFNQMALAPDTLCEICRLLNRWPIKPGKAQTAPASQLNELYGP
ncbi:MAG: BatD family protein [Pseudomonadota bacterium]